jgi:hypothetical protein
MEFSCWLYIDETKKKLISFNYDLKFGSLVDVPENFHLKANFSVSIALMKICEALQMNLNTRKKGLIHEKGT